MSNHQRGRCEWNLPRLCWSTSCHAMMFAATHYHVTDCWISYFGPSLGPTQSPIRACPHMMEHTSAWPPACWKPHWHHGGLFLFFFSLQHVCNSPAVPQIEAFSLIYHQSVKLSAEQHRLFRLGIKWEEEKKKGINNVWLQRHSHMHHLILWNETLYTKTDKKQSGEVGVIGFVASDWHSDGVNWCRWNQFPLISLPLCFVEVRYSVSKQLQLQLHWHVQKV